MKHPDYFQVLLAIDQLINALLGGFADESLSSRAHRASLTGENMWAHKVINAIFFWQENHCRDAYNAELERLHLPPSMR